MKTYELTYIVSPEISSEEAEAKGKEIESAIISREGTILKQSNPTARALAYQVEKRASGFFGVLEFQLEAEKLLELKGIIEKDGKIIRHMLIIKEAAEFKKERRTRKPDKSPEGHFDGPATMPVEKALGGEEESVVKEKTVKEKVELKDIEQKLEEILGE